MGVNGDERGAGYRVYNEALGAKLQRGTEAKRP